MSGTGDSAAKVVGIEGQRTFMDHFTSHDLQNPKRTPPASEYGSSEISESDVQEISAPTNLKNRKLKKKKAKVSFRNGPRYTC